MVETAGPIGEVTDLGVDDLVERERRYWFAWFGGKTGQRLAPISAELYRRLRAYRQGRTGRPRVRSPRLLMGEGRRPGGDYEGLPRVGIYHAVRDAAERSDLERARIHPD